MVSKLISLAITLTLFATSLGRPQAKRDASAQHLRKSSTVDIASKCNTKCCVRTHAGAIAQFAKRRPHQQREKRTKRFVFFLCVRVIETCVQLVARRIYAQLGLRPTDTPLWRVNSPRFAITLVSLATSLGRPQAKRDASAQHLHLPCDADIAKQSTRSVCA